MNIIKYERRLDTSKLMPISVKQINSIALHHMAHPTAGIDEVCNWHVDGNKWAWLGYSFWIGFDGTIYECRGLKYLAAAVAQNNNHIISIGFQGDYDQSFQMPEAQFKAGIELIKYLKSMLPNLKTIDGHYHWNNTSCPGYYFPLREMIKGVDIMFKDDTQISAYAKEAVEKIASLGIMKGDTDGNFRPKESIKREDIAVVIMNLLKVLGK